jgi:CRISPR/Cas system CSM-associated protein Csm3 (group 7 of RAMP superfamily)
MTQEARALLTDPGGVRQVAARWTVTADMVLATAAHFGGGAGEATDMVLLRDAHSGKSLLPGASLAGALRSHLCDRLGGYQSDEDERVAHLFGSSRVADAGMQSPLVVFDSMAELPSGRMTEIRDGVQIETQTGLAEDRKKFDMEVLPAETRFPLRFDLVIPSADSEQDLIELLTASLSGLSDDSISIGMRRSRGLGAVSAVRWRAERFELSSRDGWLRWLMTDAYNPISGDAAPVHDAAAACSRTWPGHSFESMPDNRRRILINASVSAKGGILVRSASSEPDAPDAAHLRSSGRSVLPGTSLAGVLRAHALRIARQVRQNQCDAEDWVNRIFGPRFAGVTRQPTEPLLASKLRISEGFLDNGARMRPSRVRIDRLTQGVAPGALFDEEPDYGGTVTVRFELRNPEPGEAGLLFLLLKDLLDGALPVGGAASVGHGLLRGTGAATMADGSILNLDPCSGNSGEQIDAEIRKFWNEATVKGGSS